MSDNRNDFDFDDDLFNGNGDDNGYNFADDEVSDLPPGLGDSYEEDMPVIEEEGEGGTSRTFIVVIGLLVLVFLGGLALVFFLISRPQGPTPNDLTSTQVVLLNLTVQAQFAGTQTQAAIFDAQTRTADAFTDTPTPSDTPTVATRPPTVTPTPTLNQTDLAGTAQALALAQTATALAAQTATPLPVTPTDVPTNVPTEVGNVGLAESFQTQVAFATQQGIAAQNAFATQLAFSTNAANNAAQIGQQGTQVAGLIATQQGISTTIADAQNNLTATVGALQAQATSGTPMGDMPSIDALIPGLAETQSAFGTQVAQGGFSPGIQVANAFATQIANAVSTSQQNVTATVAAMEAMATAGTPMGDMPPMDDMTGLMATQGAIGTQIAQGGIGIGREIFSAFGTQIAIAIDAAQSNLNATLVAAQTATDASSQVDLSLLQNVQGLVATQSALQTSVAQLQQGDTSASEALISAFATQLADTIGTAQANGGGGGSGTQVAQVATATPSAQELQDLVATQGALQTQAAGGNFDQAALSDFATQVGGVVETQQANLVATLRVQVAAGTPTGAAPIGSTLEAIAGTQAALQTAIPEENPDVFEDLLDALAEQLTSIIASAQAQAQASNLQSLLATQSALQTQIAGGDPNLAGQIANIFGTQVASILSTQQSNLNATVVAVSTQAAGGTQVADLALLANIQALAATQAALQTLIAQPTASPAVATDIPSGDFATQVAATQAALDAQIGDVGTAIANVNQGLQNFGATVVPFGTQLAQFATAQVTRAVVLTPAAQATAAAQATQAFFATVQAGIASGNQLVQDALATQAANATFAAAGTEIAGIVTDSAIVDIQQTQSALATIFVNATQSAQDLATPLAFATQLARATQEELNDRATLVAQALSGTLLALQPTATTPAPLSGINLTATALAGIFQQATQAAGTPVITPGATVGFPTLAPTALPQTGLFDEVAGGTGGSLGILAIAVVGLVGVIVMARRLRSRTETPVEVAAEAAPVQPREE